MQRTNTTHNNLRSADMLFFCFVFGRKSREHTLQLLLIAPTLRCYAQRDKYRRPQRGSRRSDVQTLPPVPQPTLGEGCSPYAKSTQPRSQAHAHHLDAQTHNQASGAQGSRWEYV